MDEPTCSPSQELPSVLLVEQDVAMCAMLTKMLSDHYRVAAVSDALAACQITKSDPPDIVVIDLYHPGTDNLTLIRSLRADPRTEGLPIVMLTASVNRELLLRCLTRWRKQFPAQTLSDRRATDVCAIGLGIAQHACHPREMIV